MDIDFFEKVNKLGGRAYLVGGAVRDKILGFGIKDIDIEVFGLTHKALYNLLASYGKVKLVGRFQIFLLNESIEIFNNETMDISESSKRRDLTINAIYYDPLNDKYYDYFFGQKDLESKILRYCDKNSFLSDPLRFLRVAYFFGKYGFSIDTSLTDLIIHNKEKILEVSPERIFHEFERILSLTNNLVALELLENFGILEILIGKNKNIHKLKNKDRIILWSILALGNDNFPYFFIGDKKLLKNVLLMKENYLKLMVLERKFSIYEFKKIASNCPMKPLLRVHYEINKNLFLIKLYYREYLKFRRNLKPLIYGRDLVELGFTNEKNFGKILESLYDSQLQGCFSTKDEAINYVKSRYKEFTNFS